MGTPTLFVFLIVLVSRSEAAQNDSVDNSAGVVSLTENKFDAELARKSVLVIFHVKGYGRNQFYH